MTVVVGEGFEGGARVGEPTRAPSPNQALSIQSTATRHRCQVPFAHYKIVRYNTSS